LPLATMRAVRRALARKAGGRSNHGGRQTRYALPTAKLADVAAPLVIFARSMSMVGNRRGSDVLKGDCDWARQSDR